MITIGTKEKPSNIYYLCLMIDNEGGTSRPLHIRELLGSVINADVQSWQKFTLEWVCNFYYAKMGTLLKYEEVIKHIILISKFKNKFFFKNHTSIAI